IAKGAYRRSVDWRHRDIWEQIEEKIRTSIATRELRAGDAVPSTRKMARMLGVAPNTVHRAYVALVKAGVLVSRRGIGIFVPASSVPPISDRERALEDAADAFAALAAKIGAPLDEAAQELAGAYGKIDGDVTAALSGK
ncbi:MAG TPA: GntR family transcriptional regulator, partial [Thermoanaerobaculia bacterium]|nr:GntR family transcriptional regulator [Thermoanaerobaculia bacterium]